LHFVGPNQTLYNLLGSRALGDQTLTTLSLFYWFNRAYRAHPMPTQLEALSMARATKSSYKGIFPVLMLAAALGILSFCWSALHVTYQEGASAHMQGWINKGPGGETYGRLAGWLSAVTPPDRREAGGMLAGFFFSSLLFIGRLRIVGFPFHPVGYALSGGWSMLWAWFSLFIAWVFKVLILKYGGLSRFREFLPFFFGLILGDFMMGATWTLLGMFLDIPVYNFWNG
jgi:hypothetical protein